MAGCGQASIRSSRDLPIVADLTQCDARLGTAWLERRTRGGPPCFDSMGSNFLLFNHTSSGLISKTRVLVGSFCTCSLSRPRGWGIDKVRRSPCGSKSSPTRRNYFNVMTRRLCNHSDGHFVLPSIPSPVFRCPVLTPITRSFDPHFSVFAFHQFLALLIIGILISGGFVFVFFCF